MTQCPMHPKLRGVSAPPALENTRGYFGLQSTELSPAPKLPRLAAVLGVSAEMTPLRGLLCL